MHHLSHHSLTRLIVRNRLKVFRCYRRQRVTLSCTYKVFRLNAGWRVMTFTRVDGTKRWIDDRRLYFYVICRYRLSVLQGDQRNLGYSRCVHLSCRSFLLVCWADRRRIKPIKQDETLLGICYDKVMQQRPRERLQLGMT